jgi:hypothetical protein
MELLDIIRKHPDHWVIKDLKPNLEKSPLTRFDRVAINGIELIK